MTTSQPAPAPTRPTRASPGVVVAAACTVPVLVAGGFAMLAVVPVTLVLAMALLDVRLRAFRAGAVVLAATVAVPLVLRAAGPAPGASLSRSMSPTLTAIVVAVSLAVAAVFLVVRRRPASHAARYS